MVPFRTQMVVSRLYPRTRGAQKITAVGSPWAPRDRLGRMWRGGFLCSQERVLPMISQPTWLVLLKWLDLSLWPAIDATIQVIWSKAYQNLCGDGCGVGTLRWQETSFIRSPEAWFKSWAYGTSVGTECLHIRRDMCYCSLILLKAA